MSTMYSNGYLIKRRKRHQLPDETVEDYECWVEYIRHLFVEDCDIYDEANIDEEKLVEKANTLYPIFARDGQCSSPKRKIARLCRSCDSYLPIL